MAERRYPSSKVRGGDWECQAAMVQEQLRRATPHPRSGVAAETSYTTPEVRSSGQDDLPHVRGQEWRHKRGYHMPEVRGGIREEQRHVQEGKLHGRGGLRGATPHSRSRGTAVRRYPSSKIRSSGCALLEQP